jgi:hypothetical protein
MHQVNISLSQSPWGWDVLQDLNMVEYRSEPYLVLMYGLHADALLLSVAKPPVVLPLQPVGHVRMRSEPLPG